LEHFFENHRGSGGKFISHRVAVRFFYKPSRRGSGAVVCFYKLSRCGSGAVAFFSNVAVRQRQLFSRDGHLC
jgi:hypothetical protein